MITKAYAASRPHPPTGDIKKVMWLPLLLPQRLGLNETDR